MSYLYDDDGYPERATAVPTPEDLNSAFRLHTREGVRQRLEEARRAKCREPVPGEWIYCPCGCGRRMLAIPDDRMFFRAAVVVAAFGLAALIVIAALCGALPEVAR